eukprot:5939243-Pyramimonas_sp.AAC.1
MAAQTQGGGPPEQGQAGGWKGKRSRPPAPRGLVGFGWPPSVAQKYSLGALLGRSWSDCGRFGGPRG